MVVNDEGFFLFIFNCLLLDLSICFSLNVIGKELVSVSGFGMLAKL